MMPEEINDRCRHCGKPRSSHGGFGGGNCFGGQSGYEAALDHLCTDRTVNDMESVDVEDEQVERFNRDQRIRREAYEEALKEDATWGLFPTPQSRAERAAERYPLRKRVPKALPDVHGCGVWSVDDSGFLMWSDPRDSWAQPPAASSAERVRALAALLDDPWDFVDDTEPEEVSGG